MASTLVAMFVSTITIVYTLAHVVIYKSLHRGLGLSQTGRWVLAGILIASSSLFIIARAMGHRNPSLTDILGMAGAIWLGILAITFSMVVFKHIILFGAKVTIPHVTPTLPSLDRTLSIALLIAIPFLTGLSLWRGHMPRVVKKDIVIDRVPFAPAVTIAQLTDLHLGRIRSAEWFSRVVDETLALKPDLIVITGDLIDDPTSIAQPFLDVARRLRAPLGVFAIPGNHEYYTGFPLFKAFLTETNIRLLVNESLVIDNRFVLAGIDEPMGHHGHAQETVRSTVGPDIPAALANMDIRLPVVLLSHRPENFKLIERADPSPTPALAVDVQLSGHTHSGQIMPIEAIVPFLYRHHHGLYRVEKVWKNPYTVDGADIIPTPYHASIYTSPGTGSWGPPMRGFSKGEITLITLRSEKYSH